MRLFVLFISFLTLSYSFAQDSTKYRFSFGVSGLSILNYGLKDLKNVPGPYYPDYHKVYQNESYTLDYQNFSFSRGINYNLSGIILNTPKFFLKIGANVFLEKYNEELTWTLSDIGDGSLIDYGMYTPKFTSQDIPLGYSENVIFSNDHMRLSGVLLEMSIMYELKNNWTIGAGIFYVTRGRFDQYETEVENSYQPWGVPRGTGYYNTKQMGLALELQKSIGRFNGIVSLAQPAITTKKSENKGGNEFRDMQSTIPLSQNLDFRFPLIIKFGVAVEFGKIK